MSRENIEGGNEYEATGDISGAVAYEEDFM
jgi:hypothetical protein